MENVFAVLVLVSLACFLLSWLIPNTFSPLFGNKLSKGKIRLVFGLSIIVFFSPFLNSNHPVSENKKVSEQATEVKQASPEEQVKTKEVKSENTQLAQPDTQAQEAKPVEQKPAEETNPIKRIETIVSGIAGKSEITIWDSKGNFAKETTKPPYEVIVNAGKGDIASCFYAKNVAFEVMKKLYSDEIVKDKISRVLFTSWGHLRTSLGSEDGLKMDWSPVATSPTGYWTTMMKYKSYEDETGPLSQRTWGKEIANDCSK
jgi:hypothetical protein